MRSLVFTATLLLFCHSVKSQLDTVNIDLGSGASSSPLPWNNITNQNNGSVANCLNYLGYQTGITVTVTDSFNGVNTAGLNANDSLQLTNNACVDNFFGSNVPAVGGFQITGGLTFYHLDPTQAYHFALFASRTATDNRDTRYVAVGSNTDSAFLNVSSNVDYIARIHGIFPKSDSTIAITCNTGPNNNNVSGYYYLGAIQMTFINTTPPPPKELTLTFPNGIEHWEIGKTATISWNSTAIANVGLDYSINDGNTWLPIAASTSGLAQSYSWVVPSPASDQCLVRVYDVSDPTMADTSDAPFDIIPLDTHIYRIVVLGSSTAAGTGPSPVDSAWVWRYRAYMTQKDTRFEVINLARGGFTTYNILPTGTPIPASVAQTIDTARNITKALSLSPDAIIINLPSNDAARNYPVADQLANYDSITAAASVDSIPLWICTPQPRNFSAAQVQIQLDMVDSTNARYGDFAIDFWTGLHKTDGTMDNAYNSGDGVHMNNAGHFILFKRVVGENICAYLLKEEEDTTVIPPDGVIEYERDFFIYPNPATDRIFFDSRFLIPDSRFQIWNHSGALVQSGSIVHSSYIDLTELKEGMYLLQLEIGEKSVVQQFVIQRR